MNQEVKDKWTAALRSGEFHQGHSALRRYEGRENPDTFCCLGVLCELAVKDEVIPPAFLGEDRSLSVYGTGDASLGNTSEAYLPTAVQAWARFENKDANVVLPHGKVGLADLNDSGLTFDQIADVIENFA